MHTVFTTILCKAVLPPAYSHKDYPALQDITAEHMRISGGNLKGRKIGQRKMFRGSGRGERLRPTSAKVREALFDILREKIAGAVFVDLYAGTGTVGLEALSRGARRVILVEADRRQARLLREAVEQLGLKDRAEVRSARASEFIGHVIDSSLRMDVVFADPPYASDEAEITLNLLGEHPDSLPEHFRLVIEHPSKKALPGEAGGMSRLKQYKYGDTMLTLYAKRS